MARWIMIAGGVPFAIGAILHFAPGLLNCFGKLAGDINMKTDNGRIFVPLTSMIIVSVVFTVLVNLLKR